MYANLTAISHHTILLWYLKPQAFGLFCQRLMHGVIYSQDADFDAITPAHLHDLPEIIIQHILEAQFLMGLSCYSSWGKWLISYQYKRLIHRIPKLDLGQTNLNGIQCAFIAITLYGP